MARDRLAAVQSPRGRCRRHCRAFEGRLRREEIDAARARVAAVDAQIATLEKSKADATVTAPIDGIVTERLLEPGEMAAPRAPIVVVLTDLDHAWAEVFVDEPDDSADQAGKGRGHRFNDAGDRAFPAR